MGCAISLAFMRGDITYQYTEAGLLQFNPTQPTYQQFSLAPLGKQNRPVDMPLAITDQEDPPVINGMIVFDRFIPRLRAMGGTRFIGSPITQPIVDQDQGRIIQFFENVAFYTSTNDSKDRTHLLSLGVITCPQICTDATPVSGIPSEAVYSEPFVKDILRLGTDLTGNAVSSYYRTPDGYIEQVYTNVVVRAALQPPYRVTLQPLPSWVGYNDNSPYFQPTARIDDPGLIFNKFAVSELGFNEAVIFEHYVATHGSKAMSGPVISQIFAVQDFYRQCYTNYCLDYYPDTQTIRPAPLGIQYLKLHPPEKAAIDSLVIKPGKLLLKVVASNPLISSQERQKITMLVFQVEDQSPIPNLDGVITVILPDRSQQSYSLPPTNELGKSSVSLAPISAANGTLIPYTVCLDSPSQTPICIQDTFTIWGNP